ncbi:hypothetical protein ACN28E_49470 [Archangium lansingense]|uniref:hypothetical protein n=1 Tax=Archangium lansingense TaxID=2995310 RepID=UPI003B7890B1
MVLLRRRARRILMQYSLGELQSILKELQSLGEIGVFGGLLRDSALDQPRRFRSDVDLVIDVQDEKQFDRFFRARNARLNRFGGYRLSLSLGSVDVWPLHRTWAFRMGILRGASLRDLLGTTYFSWDSIVYSWSTQRLYCRDTYLKDIQERVVELELAENPNPLGALVRTLRLLASGRAGLGRKLAYHTFVLLESYALKDILSAERRGYRVSYLNEELIRQLSWRLKHFVETASDAASFKALGEQLSFPFTRYIALPEAAAQPSDGSSL